MTRRYINLDCAEKAIINLVNWDNDDATVDTIRIRNYCLEVLSQIEDFIDISDNCSACSSDSHIEALSIKDLNNNVCVSKLKVNYCPVCGKRLNGSDNTG